MTDIKAFKTLLYSKSIRNTTRCNNHNDLLHLSFVLKIALFSDASLEPSRVSMTEFFTKIISC